MSWDAIVFFVYGIGGSALMIGAAVWYLRGTDWSQVVWGLGEFIWTCLLGVAIMTPVWLILVAVAWWLRQGG